MFWMQLKGLEKVPLKKCCLKKPQKEALSSWAEGGGRITHTWEQHEPRPGREASKRWLQPQK